MKINIERINEYKNKIKAVYNFIPWVILMFAAGVFIYSVVNGIYLNSLVNNQDMAKYWGKNYRHVAVYARGNGTSYIDTNMSLSESDIGTIREYLQNVYDQQSVEFKGRGLKEDKTPNGWEDSYCSYTEGGNVNEVDADLFGIGGNFNAFHDFEILSGGFLPEEEFDSNLVMVNERLAWKLYLSTNVAGNEIDINGYKYRIVGVIRDNKGSKIEDYTNGKNYRCYLYMDEFKKVTKTDEVSILSYEAFLPEFTKGVAITDIKNALPLYSEFDPKIYVISNTNRFGIRNLYEANIPLGHKEYLLNSYKLPFWELMACQAERRIFVNILLGSSGFIVSILSVGILIYRHKKQVYNNNY